VCGIDNHGAAYCWGYNFRGEVGDGGTADQAVPVPVATNLVFASIYAGRYHTCALTPNGDAYCWGENDTGQLGDSTNTPSSYPIAVRGGKTFTMLGLGVQHTCGIQSGVTQKLFCWGGNRFGQLGDGTQIDRPLPAAVRPLSAP